MQKIAMGKDNKSGRLAHGDVPDYPIALYSKINTYLTLLLISMIPIIIGLFMIFMANVEQRWVLFNMGCVFLFIGMIGCFIATKNKSSIKIKRPILVIDELGLRFVHYYSLQKPQTYSWDYIESINLERFKNIGQSRWILEIQPKVGRAKELLLLPLYLKGTLLTQEEIYHLIEQVYNRQRPIYKKIEKQNERPSRFNKQDLQLTGIVLMIVIVQFIVLSLLA